MFDYIFVLASVIIGLAVTHLLQGVAGLIDRDRAKPLYWVHLVWVANLFITCVFWWWFEFGMRHVGVWTFELYAFVLLYAVLIYMSCAVLFPRSIDGYDSWRTWFMHRRVWFYGLMALRGPVDLLDTWFKGSSHFESLGLVYVVSISVISASCLVAIFWRNRWYQGFAAVGQLAYLLWFVPALFNTVA